MNGSKDILSRIFARKREEVAAAKAGVSLEELKERALGQPPTRGFKAAIDGSPFPVALVAEVKKASPSKGVIRGDFDAEAIARTYERAGADTLSVLTDVDYFQGSAANLAAARASTHLPCLRKDFIDDPYQVYEARAWGADAILLIVAALSEVQVSELSGIAAALGMDVLVEVHSENEAVVALDLGCPLVGVNNRNLVDFKEDLGVSEALIPTLKRHCTVISESSLSTFEDVERVHRAGARGVLIGTTFAASPDMAAKVHEVMGR